MCLWRRFRDGYTTRTFQLKHFDDDSMKMGVGGLTSYVNSFETLWKRQTELKNTKLIIDGCSLYIHLCKAVSGCRFGGQYEEFYDAILQFFNALDRNGVEYFVVLDGAQHASGKKLEKHKKNAKDLIKKSCALAENRAPEDGEDFVLPLLSKRVFLQVVMDRGVKFAVCDR